MKISVLFESLMERFANRRASRHELPNPVVHMFVQDVHTSVVPYGHRRDGPITGRLEGSEPDIAVATLTLRSLAEDAHGWEGPNETIPDVVRTVVQQMLWRGYAAFIIEEPTHDDRRRRTAVGTPTENELLYRPLRSIPYGWVFRTPFGMVEVLGRMDRWQDGRQLIRFYRRSRVWLVDIPRSLGGRWGFWWMCKRLQFFSGVFPKWSTEGLFKEQARLEFDVAGYGRLRAAYRALTAARWGWTARDVSTAYQTEFFAVYRTVTFHHSLAVLRETVLHMLNGLLTQRLGLRVRAELAGVPAPSNILKVRDQMERGSISLLDALAQAGIT